VSIDSASNRCIYIEVKRTACLLDRDHDGEHAVSPSNDVIFLREVERRAGKTREEIAAHLARVEGWCDECRWLAQIYGLSGAGEED
jgi:hypothetical protein